MSQTSIFNPTVAPLLKLTSYIAMLLFVLLTIVNWTGLEAYSALWLFRLFSLASLTFIAGSLFAMALIVNLDQQQLSFELNEKGLVWGAILVFFAGSGAVLLEPKVGLFVSGLLFLVLWQVELKSNLAKAYPDWFWQLRTQVSMVIALCHILLWMTLGL